jgi:hypothetical protein
MRNLLLRKGLFIAAFVALCAGCARWQDAVVAVPGGSGIAYELIEIYDPRPVRVHAVRVDMSGGNLFLDVVLPADPDGDGPAEAALTDPLAMAAAVSPLLFVNTNPWDGLPLPDGKPDRKWRADQPVQILGLAASDGEVRSPGEGYVAIWTDASGRVHFGTPPEDGSVVEGVAGFGDILVNGEVTVPPGGDIHPRTALGVDEAGQTLWIVVADGRQKGFSEGMTLHELGTVMARIGCRHAANMDGGGSSVLGMTGPDGALAVVNSPSDRNAAGKVSLRPLPLILTVQER